VLVLLGALVFESMKARRMGMYIPTMLVVYLLEIVLGVVITTNLARRHGKQQGQYDMVSPILGCGIIVIGALLTAVVVLVTILLSVLNHVGSWT